MAVLRAEGVCGISIRKQQSSESYLNSALEEEITEFLALGLWVYLLLLLFSFLYFLKLWYVLGLKKRRTSSLGKQNSISKYFRTQEMALSTKTGKNDIK